MYDTLKKVLSDQFGVTIDEINDGTCIVKDLGADSIDIVEVVMNLEKIFKIKIEQEEYEGRSTVKALADLINQKLV